VRTSHLRYLILAAVCHIALTITIFLIGHFQLLPSTFDQNGIGLTFAIDGTSYQALASEMAGEWQNNGFVAWVQTKSPLHCRLYSLTFATFGKLLGHNILAAEPLNLLYYLGTLICIYFLGREVFNARAGLLAASIVGVWPSFLLHSAQLLRDPLSILCFLTLIVILILLLGRDLRWRQALGIGTGSALLVALLWVVRGNMWNLVLVAIVLTLAMLGYRMIRERKFMIGNAAVILIIFFVALLVPTRLESTSLPGQIVPVTPLAIPSANQPARSEGIWTNTIKQMGQRREGFRIYKSRASDLDTDVRFRSGGDIVRYIPRAAVIGFFAPFPRMWIQAGSFGSAARLLSGVEMLAMYFLYIAVAYYLWRERANARMWLLFLVAAIGVIALGLVVVNAGALYRIRYVFWMMFILIGSHGFTRMNADLKTAKCLQIRVHPRKSVAST
jgi:4-amino-4-deoxy-L-arabinose transferase-like glycosyltransferase